MQASRITWYEMDSHSDLSTNDFIAHKDEAAFASNQEEAKRLYARWIDDRHRDRRNLISDRAT